MASKLSRRPKTAFIFAGGGSYGAAQVGMLRALCARDIRPELVMGSSVGAINGVFYAGMPNGEGIERLESLWRGLRRQDVFPIALASLFGALRNSDHLFEPSSLRRLLAMHLPKSRLEDSVIPVHVMATALLTGSPVCLSAGAAVAAVLASCAIPAIYPPVQIDDQMLIDGGVACSTPIGAAIELGATRLIVLPTSFACPHDTPPIGVLAMAFHAMGLSVMRQLDRDIRLYADRAEIVVVAPICPIEARPYDFSGVARMIDLAAQSTERWLESGGLSRTEAQRIASGRAGTLESVKPMPAGGQGECTASLPSCVVRMARRRHRAQ